MDDKQIIEICAELCGIKGQWWATSNDFAGSHFGTSQHPSNAWNPLTDANDERMVLEAIGKLTDVDLYVVIRDAIDKHPIDLDVGDISRACAKAIKETEKPFRYPDGTTGHETTPGANEEKAMTQLLCDVCQRLEAADIPLGTNLWTWWQNEKNVGMGRDNVS